MAVTAGAMAHEVAAIAALALRPGYWSASEGDPQGWRRLITFESG